MFYYYTKALKNYVKFTGRATRKEYWMFVLVNVLISILLQALIYASPVFMYIYFLYSLFIFLPGFALAIRRYHDCDWSGWWFLCPFINVVLLFLPSDKNVNRFDETQSVL